ncbi:MAG: tandem-95 repeat protein [Alphaproteobacteria bacterium]|nr:tandem-95 repeat protein [Alphaproteobacteria bacterium]
MAEQRQGPVNQAVTLTIANNATLAEDGSLVVNFAAQDPDGGIVTMDAVSSNTAMFGAGTMTFGQGAGGRTLTLAPGLHQNGAAILTVTAASTDGTSATKTVSVTVTPVNDAPTATNKTVTMDEDTVRALAIADFGYSDIENTAISAVRFESVSAGSLQYFNGTAWGAATLAQAYNASDITAGNMRFVPVANANGNAYSGLTYKVSDGDLWSVASKTLTVDVTPVNDAPTISATAASTARGQSVSLATKLVAADLEQAAANLTYTITAGPTDGSVWKNGVKLANGGTFTQADINSGLVSYLHHGAYGVGDDSFTYSLTDGDGATLTGQNFALTVGANAAAPQNIHAYAAKSFGSLTSFTFLDDTNRSFSGGTTVTYTLTGVSGPFTSATLRIGAGDVDYFWGERDLVRFNGNNLGYLQGQNNQFSITTFTVNPAWIVNGTNQISVTVDNGWAVTTDWAKLTVSTTPLSGATVSALNIVGGTVVGTTAYADTNAVVAVTSSGNYRADFKLVSPAGEIVATQSVSFTGTAGQSNLLNASLDYPVAKVSGTYQVQMSLVQASGGTGQTIKFQTFAHVQNSGPNIAEPTLVAPETAAIGTVVARFGHSDTDLNQTMTYSLADNAGGKFSLVQNASGIYELKVAAGLNYATATSHIVQVKVTDAAGLSRVESFTVNVSNVNTAPTAYDVGAYTSEDVAVTGAAGFSDPDGDTLSYTVTGQPSHGTASIAADGTWTYTPAANWSGTDTFQLTADDDGAGPHVPVTSTVTVTVDPVNDAPAVTLAKPAMVFDGNDYLTLPTAVGQTGDFTLEGWVKPGSTANWQRIFDFSENADEYMFLTVSADTGKPRFALSGAGDGTTESRLDSSVALAQNSWSHIAVTLSGTTAKMYINGAEVASGTINVDRSGFTIANAWIGKSGNAGDPNFVGSMADMRVWSTARTASQINRNMNADISGTTGLQAWYKGDSANDSTANARHATNTGVTFSGDASRSLTYFEGGSGLAVMPNITISDVDAPTQMGGATISISANLTSGDTLTFVNQNGITGSYDSATGVLTLSGKATLAQYKAAVESVTFSSTSATPTANAATRAISLVLNDGESANNLSSAVTNTIAVSESASPIFAGASDGRGALSVSAGEYALANLGTGTITNTATIEMVVKLTGPLTKHNLMWVGDGTDPTTAKRFVFEVNNGILGLWTNPARIDSTTTLSADTWYHIAASYDGATVKLYVNGDLVLSQATTLSSFQLTNAAQYVGIGADINSTLFPSVAQIDEARVWSVARTDAQIKASYNKELAGTESGLAGYWRFDELANSATDLSGNNRTAVFASNSLPMVLRNGNDDRTLNFDGVNDYVSVADAAALTPSSITVEAWVKLDVINANTHAIVTKGPTGGYSYHLQIVNGKIEWATGANGGQAFQSSSTLTAGQWVHVAATLDATTGVSKIYLNGVEDATHTYGAAGIPDSTGVLGIGAWNDNGTVSRYFDGQIADVRIWSTVRDQTQVSSDMVTKLTGAESALASNWRLTDGSGTIATNIDNISAWAGMPGTISGANWVAATPRVQDTPERALSFDGTNDYVSLPTDIATTTDFTFEAWVRPDTATPWQRIFDVNNGSTTKFMGMVNASQHNGGLRFTISTTGGGGGEQIVEGPALQVGVWSHVAVTLAGDTATLYVNGVAVATSTITLNPIDLGATIATLGKSTFSSDPYYDGLMADVRVWNLARSGSAIAAAMNAPLTGTETGLIGYWRTNEGSGTTISNAADGGAAGTLVNGTAWANVADPVYDTQLATNANTVLTSSLKATNLDNGAITYSMAGNPSHGTVAMSSTGTFTYTPTQKYVGTDSFIVTASDGATSTNQTITVAVNDPVTAASAASQSRANTGVSLAGGKYLASSSGVSYSTATYEAWIKTTTAGTWVGIISDQVTGSQGSLTLAIKNTGVLGFEAWQPAGARTYTGTTAITDGQWHHVAATWDGTTGAIYVDGMLENSTLTTNAGTMANFAINNQTLVVGANSSLGGTFTGSIDEVRVWNTVRTATEIKTNMSRALEGDTPGLYASYDFEEGAVIGGVSAYNSSSTNNLVEQGSGSLTWTNGGNRGAVVLNAGDGTNDHVALTNNADSLDLGASGSIELWVKRQQWNTTTDQAIIGTGVGNQSENAFYLSAHMNVGLHFRYGGSNQTGSTYICYQGSDNWAANSWHHVAATWSSGNLKLYADGQLVDSATTTLVFSDLAPSWNLGQAPANSGDTTWASGMTVDDVRIWTSVRSQAEIAADMNAVATGSETGLQGYWKMDEASGTTLLDATGHGNTGTLSNGAWVDSGPLPVQTSTVPVLKDTNYAISLDGTNDYASVSGINLANSSFSVEFWSYRGGNSDADYALSMGTVNLDGKAMLAGYSSTSDAFVFGFKGDSLIYNDGDADNDVGQWIHWAGTYDSVNTALKLYKNGTQVQQASINETYSGDATVFLGKYLDSGYFDGRLDEVRIWSDVRTATEIKENYTKHLVGNEDNLAALWHFDEASGTVASDATLNNRDLTLSNGPTWDDLMTESVALNGSLQALAQGSETDSGALTYTLIGGNGGATHGTASIDNHGVLTYTGSSQGTDNVSYQVSDASGATSAGIFQITVT